MNSIISNVIMQECLNKPLAITLNYFDSEHRNMRAKSLLVVNRLNYFFCF